MLTGGIMRKFLLFTFLVSGLLYMSGCGLSDNTVAKVDGTEISAEIFKQQLSRRYGQKDSFADVDSAAKMTMLNNLILNELKASAGRDLGLDKEAEFITENKMMKSRILGNRYFEKVIVDKLFPEEDIRADFDKQKEQVKASHILLGYKGAQGSRATRTKDEALALASELITRTTNGEDFAGLAEKYSDDPSAKKNKGDLGFFAWGRMVPAFQEAAFKMTPGEISDPVETSYGFHVIKVVERSDNPAYNADNFEKEKFNIKRKLYITKKDSGTAMWNRHSDKVRADYNFKGLEENLAKVIEATNAKQMNVTADAYSEEEKQLVLATWSGGKLVLNDMFTLYGKRFSALKPKLTNLALLQNEIKNASLQDLIIADAEKMGVNNDSDIKAQLQDAENSKLASLAEAKEVREKAEPTSEEIKAYYTEHSEDFVRPAEMEIWEIYVTNEKLANKIAGKAKAGSDFEKLAAKYSEDKNYKKKKGYLGYKQENRRGEVSKKAFEIGANKFGGPIKYRKGWAVLKTGKLKETTLRSFEDVQTQVKSKVRNNKLKELRENWEKELRSKYSVKINTALVEKI